jgi:hypothetical protein
MKAMEIDSSGWTDEMRQNAVRKLEELGYHEEESDNKIGILSISVFQSGYFTLFDDCGILLLGHELTPTYEQLMAMTKEDVA